MHTIISTFTKKTLKIKFEFKLKPVVTIHISKVTNFRNIIITDCMYLYESNKRYLEFGSLRLKFGI